MGLGNFRNVGEILSSILADWAEDFPGCSAPAHLVDSITRGTPPALGKSGSVIHRGKGMAPDAMCFSSTEVRSVAARVVAARDINGMRDGLEMVGITAQPISAEMVDFHTLGNFAAEMSPSEPMCEDMPAIDPEPTVARSLDGPGPLPATGLSSDDAGHKPVGRRGRYVNHLPGTPGLGCTPSDNVIWLKDYRRDHPRLTNKSAIANHASASAVMPSK